MRGLGEIADRAAGGLGALTVGLVAVVAGCGPAACPKGMLARDDHCFTPTACDLADGGCQVDAGLATDAGVASDASEPDSDAGSPGDGNDGGADDASLTVDAAVDAAGCDLNGSPRDEPCLLDERIAVFVSTTGDDATGDGTMAAPKRTLGAALQAARERDVVHVIVCGGTYEEPVRIEAGVRVHGGFACSGGWRHVGLVTSFEPTDAEIALRVDDVADPVVFEDVAFVARDGAAAGESSVAAVVSGSDDVLLRDVDLTAGRGQDGADGRPSGTTVGDFTFPQTSACADPALQCLEGLAAVGISGGAERVYTCPGGDSTTGGLGGDDGAAGAEPGSDGLPSLGLGAGGAGGAGSCASGEDGAGGEDGAPGSGASVLGAPVDVAAGTSAVAWQPMAGDSGEHGRVGQGGGGGGARASSGGGGGGGAGGCGGAGGTGGGGGGASIALLVVGSGVTVDGGHLVTSDGGNGGKGATGQPGMRAGGLGGSGGSCNGGTGGPGGDGGAGGGGAGGISVGIVHQGPTPAVSAGTTFEHGREGSGGDGGDAGATTDDGIAGVSGDVLSL